VTGDQEPLVAERTHHGEAVLGHRPLGVSRVLDIAARAGAGAVAAQIGITRVKWRANSGATLCQQTCVCG
jgi:hypothetical protein